MKQLITQGIVLSRTDYGEADRIITMLTPDYGKLRLMAKGVRRVKSKLAGGIELFSVSHITFIKGRGEVNTLISTRLSKHYGNVVGRIERVQLGYELIKLLNKTTEDHPEEEYFKLLEQAFAALDDLAIDDGLVRLWFYARLLKLGGHQPNLFTDSSDEKLKSEGKYIFDTDTSAFEPNEHGPLTSDHIKFLRLVFSGNQPKALAKVEGTEKLVKDCLTLIQTMQKSHISV